MTDIKVDIISADYQRNGVGGEGFYAAMIRCDGETLLATIAYGDDGETFDETSCRVTDPLDLTSHYRGDRIGAVLVPKLVEYLKQSETESEEKNITKEFGCYSAELNIEYDGDDLVSWCHVSTTRRGQDYCSSLGVVENFGTIEAESGDVINVPDAVADRIHKWALANGY